MQPKERQESEQKSLFKAWLVKWTPELGPGIAEVKV